MQVLSQSTLNALAELSRQFESSTPQEVLAWAMQEFSGRLTMATAFGAEGCALIDMIARLHKEKGLAAPDIFNLDTGYQFQETLDLRERIQDRYGIPVRLVSAAESTAKMERRYGGPIYGTNPNQCCYERKVVPLQEAVQGFAAWVTAIRRDQTPERATQPIVGAETNFVGMVKINPLANWTHDQVWNYVKEFDVPTNPLHAMGYPSIGCYPCTRAIAEGEDARAGRWSGSSKTECGLHVDGNGHLQSSSPQPVKLFL